MRHLFVRHRRIPTFLESDQTGGAPEFPLRSLFERNELDDRLARLGDDNFLPDPCLLDQLGELRLGYMYVYLHEFILAKSL